MVTLTLSLISKLAPLYLNIFLGYIAGKKLETNKDAIVKLVFYLINPLIIFNGVLITKIDLSILSLPLLTFTVACIICLIFYSLSRKIWDDSSKNIVAFSAGSGNTGYFGIPLAVMLFEPQVEGIYIMSILGITFYENTLGYYISAKGLYSPKECFYKLLYLPSIYAFLTALLINLLGIPVPNLFKEFIVHIKGVYVVLGMMIIGLSIAGLRQFKPDFKFLGMAFLAKFFAWPIIILGIIYLDSKFFNFYYPSIHQALFLLSIVPLAVNSVVMATLMKANPERTAAVVLLSTLFALFYIPLMTLFFTP